jgi:copper resistance protein B
MKRVLLLLLTPVVAAQAAEHDHSSHAEPATPVVDHAAHVHPTSAPSTANSEATISSSAAHAHLMADHGGSLNYLVLGERLEQSNADSRLWELQGWLGYDYRKLWLKTEGEYDTDAGRTGHSEVQLLYSHAVAPYWDLQAGLRRDDVGSEARTYGVIGLMGLAPYWFEVDAAAFVSEQGDVSARLEAEYELRFTQKLFLQPRVELAYSFADDPQMRVGEGVSEASVGLRLRYEWRRELAPYVGVEWARAYGNTATMLRAAGEAREDTRVVAGLRFWY